MEQNPSPFWQVVAILVLAGFVYFLFWLFVLEPRRERRRNRASYAAEQERIRRALQEKAERERQAYEAKQEQARRQALEAERAAERQRPVRRQWGLYAYLTETCTAFLADHPTLMSSTGVALRTLWFAPFSFKAGEHIPHGARDWLTADDRAEADRRLSSLAQTDIARLLARERAQTRAVSLGAITRHIYTPRTLAAQHEYEQELRRYEQERAAGYKDARKPLAPEPYPVVATPVPPALVQPEAVRFRHTYVIGRTGKGKTNFLRSLILQDMEAGRGVGVLSPETEIFRDQLLPFIPHHRRHDVLYFNPADQERPVTFNPFHLNKGESLSLKASETFTIFERAMSDLTGARMRPLLSNAIFALTERAGSTLFDLDTLLDPHDPSLRDEVIATTHDERTRKFWQETYPTYPPDAHLPLTNRLDQFLRPPVSTVLGSPTSTLNLREAMDAGQILFFNLSTGLLGEQASQLLGQLLVAHLQLALLSREDVSEDERRPFFLYLDEFQTYTSTATASYAEILAKARKYRLGLYLAHQQTQQLPAELLADIIGNVSTIVAMNVSAQDARRLAPDLFLSTPEALTHLATGDAIARVAESSYQLSIPLVEREPDPTTREAVLRHSRARYGVPVSARGSPPTPHPQTPSTSQPDPLQRTPKSTPDPDNEFLG